MNRLTAAAADPGVRRGVLIPLAAVVVALTVAAVVAVLPSPSVWPARQAELYALALPAAADDIAARLERLHNSLTAEADVA